VQFREEADQVLQAAAEPIDRPSHYHVELPLGGVPAQPIEGRARRDRADAVQLTNGLDVKEIVNLWAGGSSAVKLILGRQLE
jgi:hypothetical protein